MEPLEIHCPLGEFAAFFSTSAEYGLYLRALDWCIRESGRTLPTRDWFIPDSVIIAWNERRTANRLVANGLWVHDDYERRYQFRYCYKTNTPAAIRNRRKKARDKKDRHRRNKAAEDRRGLGDVPRGSPPGDIGPETQSEW